MDYTKYQHSRDAAWQILLDQNVTELPVRISKLCENMGIEIRRFIPAEGQSDGHTLIIDGRPRILVSKTCSPQRARFTAAHELGRFLYLIIGDDDFQYGVGVEGELTERDTFTGGRGIA